MKSGEPPAAAAEVRGLGSWASPFVIRVMVALRLKGVEYELLQETMGKKSELLLASNPVHKKIPVLLHRGKPISESLIIVQYVDEVWTPASDGGGSAAPAILPRDDPYGAAIHRFWAQYIDDMFSPRIRILRGTVPGDKDEAAGEMTTALLYLEEAFIKCSKGKQYFGATTSATWTSLWGRTSDGSRRWRRSPASSFSTRRRSPTWLLGRIASARTRPLRTFCLTLIN